VEEVKWSSDRHVVQDGHTDAFGEIFFQGFENTSKYAKMSMFTSNDKILDLLYSKNYWNIKKPKLLISK
jgi:hypothetical protein